MFQRTGLALALGLVAAGPSAAAADLTLTVTTSRSLPPVEAVAVYRADTEPAAKEKPKPLVTTTKLGEPVALPGAGPFDVFVKPKGGIEVRVARKLTVEPGRAHELKLADVLGVVEVTGDGLPRADKVILTTPDDPGPDEKGHTPVQAAADYRTAMAVPEGHYAVWVKPANGARARKVEDKVRVLAGRTTRVGD